MVSDGPATPGQTRRPARTAPLASADRTAAFEAVMMMRCTAPIVARRRVTTDQLGYRSAPDANGVLNEFSRAPAAYRLVRLLGTLEIEARVDQRSEGGRHRYELYRILVSPGAGTTLAGVLDQAWRSGYLQLCRSGDRALARWQQRNRRTLAVAAWRAALMAAGRRRSGTLALRIADPDTVSVLVNAARVLGVNTRTQTRQGYQMVSLSPDSPYEQLLAVASGTDALEDAV